MLQIKLSRIGKKKKPIYRVIITEKTRDPWGKYLENLGNYNPSTKESTLKAERINYWISQGAQPSPTVHNLLVSQGVIKGEKVRASKSKPGKKRQAEIDAQKKAEADKKAAEVAAAEAAKVEEASTVEAPEAPAEEKSEAPAENTENKE